MSFTYCKPSFLHKTLFCDLLGINWDTRTIFCQSLIYMFTSLEKQVSQKLTSTSGHFHLVERTEVKRHPMRLAGGLH